MSEIKDLQFSKGVVEYNINGDYKLVINPTDSFFVEKLFNTFDALDKKQTEYEKEAKEAKKGEIFNIARKRDNEMRVMIDDALGDGASVAVFGTMNVYALADGLPVWANLLLAIMDEIDTFFANEQKKTNPRIAKYTSKYSNKISTGTQK